MALKLEWSSEQDKLAISDELIALLDTLLQKAGEAEGVTEGEVALTFVDDENIHELNRTYRGIDRPTDVLSFAMQESLGDELEIVYEVDDEEADQLDAMTDVLGDRNNFV